MTHIEKLNLLDINNYISMREKHLSSNVCWENVKRLNTHLGKTFWGLCRFFNNEYDMKFEPCMETLLKVKTALNK